jgi:hypothetical protein
VPFKEQNNIFSIFKQPYVRVIVPLV